MALAEGLSGTFDMGRVASRTFSVLGRNFLTFFLLGLVAAIPPIAFGWFVGANLGSGRAPNVAAFMTGSFWLSFVVTQILTIALNYLMQAAMIYATVMDLNGQRASFGAALSTALGSLLPVVAVAIISAVAIIVGLVLFVVPGLMLLCAWIVVVPALVVEHTGISGSFGRSLELTRGSRWPIFGLVIIYVIGLSIVNLVLGPIIGGIGLAAGTTAFPVVSLAFTGIYSAIVYALSATGVASIYYELRSIKEGVGPEHLASVFA